ncbi:hypothetical protein DY000_02015145 [Brassica cretica]|uniref:Uncharacterized protein n=1 Tax=Brassica cretica TaxID=69181 RepID=A0ABQ7CQR4_BRACR|nr:hypothetical protein DY000_02015145 [Brassica cretica]
MNKGARIGDFPQRTIQRSSLTVDPTRSSQTIGDDRLNTGYLAHGRGRPAPRSPRPWARTTHTEVTSPMGEDDPHRGHLTHGRGNAPPRSPPVPKLCIVGTKIRIVDFRQNKETRKTLISQRLLSSDRALARTRSLRSDRAERARSLRSDRALARARLLRSDRAEHAFGRCVVTLFELLSDVSCFLRKAFRKEESIPKKYLSKKVFHFLLRTFLNVNFVVTVFDPNS